MSEFENNFDLKVEEPVPDDAEVYEDIGVLFGPPPGWKPPTRWQKVKNRVNVKVTCNWLAIALQCRVRGHQYRTQKPSRCVEVTVCQICGDYRGARYIKADDSCRWHRPE